MNVVFGFYDQLNHMFTLKLLSVLSPTSDLCCELVTFWFLNQQWNKRNTNVIIIQSSSLSHNGAVQT